MTPSKPPLDRFFPNCGDQNNAPKQTFVFLQWIVLRLLYLERETGRRCPIWSWRSFCSATKNPSIEFSDDLHIDFAFKYHFYLFLVHVELEILWGEARISMDKIKQRKRIAKGGWIREIIIQFIWYCCTWTNAPIMIFYFFKDQLESATCCFWVCKYREKDPRLCVQYVWLYPAPLQICGSVFCRLILSTVGPRNSDAKTPMVRRQMYSLMSLALFMTYHRWHTLWTRWGTVYQLQVTLHF